MLKRVVAALVLAVLPAFGGRLLAVAGGALMDGSARLDTLKSASDRATTNTSASASVAGGFLRAVNR
jgi:hypothetical protein